MQAAQRAAQRQQPASRAEWGISQSDQQPGQRAGSGACHHSGRHLRRCRNAIGNFLRLRLLWVAKKLEAQLLGVPSSTGKQEGSERAQAGLVASPGGHLAHQLGRNGQAMPGAACQRSLAPDRPGVVANSGDAVSEQADSSVTATAGGSSRSSSPLLEVQVPEDRSWMSSGRSTNFFAAARLVSTMVACGNAAGAAAAERCRRAGRCRRAAGATSPRAAWYRPGVALTLPGAACSR